MRSRSNKGQLALEFAATVIFLLAFTLITVDMGFLLYGACINDKACRDAARAAAQAKDATTALSLANAAINSQRLNGDTLSSAIVSRPVIPAGGLTYQDYGGQRPPAGGLLPNVSPFVRVTTQCTSRLPFAPPAILGNVLPNSLVFQQTYTYPIVNIR